jgi:hypothetical protein
MPVTLRYVRPDLGAKLRQLEAETDELHQAAKARAPAPRRHPAMRSLNRLAVSAWAYAGRPAYRVARAAFDRMAPVVRRVPFAAAARFVAGWLSDSMRRPLSAIAIVLAVGLLVLLIAPSR